MPTVVTVTLLHTSGDMVRHVPSEEFRDLREIYKSNGKILAQDQILNEQTKTEIKTTVFKDRASYNEWINEPIVEEYFIDRTRFLQRNNIFKSVNIEDV